ncbi:hypothetical protein CEUSTIGMA_g5600.t1 [Chlamydomonas eustigma]|uniref:GYF domain-containing protein n=1 Tax=Chlamydomonas eustigma TaxID=1157962 RepID=A0A250X510_9CHLO|nr:hypothetical protein CEUSTIGMA_g5600.t1 [Chlamydomonas eustigma]|eukprot:GAX78158.1 hypothetical protein CEUSTIGMA_g5600.t1 [Chlamydomonas eustigma]
MCDENTVCYGKTASDHHVDQNVDEVEYPRHEETSHNIHPDEDQIQHGSDHKDLEHALESNQVDHEEAAHYDAISHPKQEEHESEGKDVDLEPTNDDFVEKKEEEDYKMMAEDDHHGMAYEHGSQSNDYNGNGGAEEGLEAEKTEAADQEQESFQAKASTNTHEAVNGPHSDNLSQHERGATHPSCTSEAGDSDCRLKAEAACFSAGPSVSGGDILSNTMSEVRVGSLDSLDQGVIERNENSPVTNMIRPARAGEEVDVIASGQVAEMGQFDRTEDVKADSEAGRLNSDGGQEKIEVDIERNVHISPKEEEEPGGFLFPANDVNSDFEVNGDGEQIKDSEGREGDVEKDLMDAEGPVEPEASTGDDAHGERKPKEEANKGTDRQVVEPERKDGDRGRSLNDRRDSRDSSTGEKRSREPIPSFDNSDVKRNRPRSPVPPRSRGPAHNSRHLSPPPRRHNGPDARGVGRRSPPPARGYRQQDSRVPPASHRRREEPVLSPRRRSISPQRAPYNSPHVVHEKRKSFPGGSASHHQPPNQHHRDPPGGGGGRSPRSNSQGPPGFADRPAYRDAHPSSRSRDDGPSHHYNAHGPPPHRDTPPPLHNQRNAPPARYNGGPPRDSLPQSDRRAPPPGVTRSGPDSGYEASRGDQWAVRGAPPSRAAPYGGDAQGHHYDRDAGQYDRGSAPGYPQRARSPPRYSGSAAPPAKRSRGPSPPPPPALPPAPYDRVYQDNRYPYQDNRRGSGAYPPGPRLPSPPRYESNNRYPMMERRYDGPPAAGGNYQPPSRSTDPSMTVAPAYDGDRRNGGAGPRGGSRGSALPQVVAPRQRGTGPGSMEVLPSHKPGMQEPDRYSRALPPPQVSLEDGRRGMVGGAVDARLGSVGSSAYGSTTAVNHAHTLGSPVGGAPRQNAAPMVDPEDEEVWMYRDPQGRNQGPHSKRMLRKWVDALKAPKYTRDLEQFLQSRVWRVGMEALTGALSDVLGVK